MAEGFDKSVRIKAASETLRDHFSDLVTLISANPLGVAIKLYSKKIIEKANLDRMLISGSTNVEKACHILNLVSDAAKVNPSAFETFCTILKSEGTTEELAKLMRNGYQKHCKTELESSQTNTKTKCQSCSSLQESFLEKVRAALAGLRWYAETDDESIQTSVTKAALKKFISQSQQSGSTLEHVNKHLLDLHEEEGLITDPAVYQWAQHLASEVYAEVMVPAEPAAEVSSPTEVASPSEVEKPPLFSKSTLWHASICSHAVSTCNAGDYQSFFKNKELVRGHTFKEVSISRSKQDRLLIATQDDSTFYFAFQSELTIAEWPRRFKSFQEGIEFQGKMLPVRFVVELLNTGGHRIVLTGFSFGGLLASYIATQVWNSPYITSRHLQENFVCITFAQPHITVPGLEEVARERPEMLRTMHNVYYQEDLVPRLIKYLDKPCSTLMEPESVPGVQLKVKRPPKMPFQDPLTQQLFKCLDDLHLTTTEKSIPESDTSSTQRSAVILNDHLKTLASRQSINRDTQDASGSFYLLAVDSPSIGLQFKKLASEQAVGQSSFLQTSEVDGIILTKHSMEVYARKLFLGYLQKAPEFVIPPLPKVPPPLDVVKPTVTSIVLHDHGNELALALEGENLWFCYKVSVGGVMIETPASEIGGGTSIKFNDEKERSKLNLSDGEAVEVIAHSHFSKPSTFHVTTRKKEYHTSVRQRQLARLTPSQLIELAYLSALLEQHPHGDFQSLSHKVLVIRDFLKDVVQVVPLESIAYAISYGNRHVAAKCVEALGYIQPPKSKLMVDGLFLSSQRLTSRLSPDIVSPLVSKLVASVQDVYDGLPHDLHCHASAENLNLFVATSQHEILAQKSLEWKDIKQEYNAVPEPELVNDSLRGKMEASQRMITKDSRKYGRSTAVICGLSIECLYPISATSQESQMVLESPMDTLRSGKEKLAELAQEYYASCEQNPKKLLTPQSSGNNSVMLQTVNSIRETNVATCTSLLGAFMEQQEIGIPLMKSKKDRSKALELSARASVGVWALSSLNLADIQNILKQCHGQQLLVRIENYVKGIVNSKARSPPPPGEDQYAAKLQFIIQGVRKTVTCNSQYISYSLERQLVELCAERNITASFPLERLTEQWDLLFEENILSLVAKSHRPLLARWLKWALMVNNLREELAKYTAVGVIGLVNSGKSRLVTSLFGVQIPSGTTEGKRTTVPFMYNLERAVEGLDVVDFPGVDDRDETISDLADLLLTLAQIVVFVVDYRKIHTESGKKWLERLQVEKVPVLVCLTFADKLYAEHMTEDGKDPDKKFMKRELKSQLSMITEKLQLPPSFRIKFFSFSQDRDSVLNCKEGREKLRGVGIGTHLDVGEWLVKTFKERFGQDDLAECLHEFIHSD